MRQVTAVALYGQKPSGLRDLINEYQDLIETETKTQSGLSFKPYDLDQVHATVVGLERCIGSALLNLNFMKWRGRPQQMNFEGLLTYFRSCAPLPFEVQIGGFQNREYPFTSRGQKPYERSFSVQGDKAVVMGWPLCGDPAASLPVSASAWVVESRRYPTVLDALRRHCQHFGILHGYHRQFTDFDNDFYFRIGIFSPSAIPQGFAQQLQSKVQQHMGNRQPEVFQVTLADIFAVSYDDETLPLRASKSWSFVDNQVNDAFIQDLYE